MERSRVRGADFFDQKSLEHHKSLRDEYKKIAESDSKHWKIISGQKSILDVHKEIISHLNL